MKSRDAESTSRKPESNKKVKLVHHKDELGVLNTVMSSDYLKTIIEKNVKKVQKLS